MNRHKNSQRMAYFQNLFNNLSKQHTQLKLQEDKSFQLIENKLQNTILRTIQQIQNGNLIIKEESDLVQEIIKIPMYKKIVNEVDDLDKQIEQSEQLLKQAKRQLLMHKRLQKQNAKFQNETHKKQNLEKIKAWAQQRKILSSKRSRLYRQKQQEIQLQQLKQEEQNLLKKSQEQNYRKKSVEQRLKILEENKCQRDQIFKISLEESKKIKFPKFKLIEQDYNKAIAEQNFQKQIIKKNHKLSFKLDHQLIKDHGKNYMDRIYERIKQKGYSSQRTLNSEQKELYQSQFKILLKRDDEKIQREKQKLKRRTKYQERLQQLEINVDEDKKIKMQIAKDKARNPLKYHFLRQKNLNQYQIFMEFKEFQLDIDRNQLGNNYLQEVKKLTGNSRLQKSNSVSGISTTDQQKVFKYRNYLQEMKTHRTAFCIDKQNQTKISLLLKERPKQIRTNTIVDKISSETRKMESEIKNKKIELLKLNSFTSTIKKEQEIDEIYMKSIKAKLACLQFN